MELLSDLIINNEHATGETVDVHVRLNFIYKEWIFCVMNEISPAT